MSLASAGKYQLGEGYTVGNINIAGYVNLAAEIPHDGPAQLAGDDVSLFISGRFHKYVNPFFEAEFSEATIWQKNGSLFSDMHPNFVLERLYNDARLGDNLTLRVGKMLTSVGEWNSIHAAPLVWTSTRPMTTYRSFPEYTSGLELHYTPQDSRQPEIQAYWQPNGELMLLRKSPLMRDYLHTRGLQLNWSGDLSDKLGLSFQHADLRHLDQSQTLVGLNARKTLGEFQIETEMTYTRINGTRLARVRNEEWGAYILVAYAIDDKWSLMARHENFSDRNERSGSQNTLLGFSWRPDPAMVWKLEYVRQKGARLNIRSGVFSSFSVLF